MPDLERAAGVFGGGRNYFSIEYFSIENIARGILITEYFWGTNGISGSGSGSWMEGMGNIVEEGY